MNQYFLSVELIFQSLVYDLAILTYDFFQEIMHIVITLNYFNGLKVISKF